MTPAIAVDTVRLDQLKEHAALIGRMGSGTTLLTSLLCLVLLPLFKPRRTLWCFLAGGALMHVDMLAYTLIPTFLDAPHLLFIGGTRPEPLDALLEMGYPRGSSVAAIVLLSLLQFIWLYRLARPHQGS